MTKASDPKSIPAITSSPKNWDEIKVGSLVIAYEDADAGWWEAIVTGVTDDKLTLRWRDYPKLPSIIRQRRQVALLATGSN